MIGALLGLSPDEARRARMLAEAQLLILWRGKTVGKGARRKAVSPFVMLLWSNLVLGCMLPFMTSMGVSLATSAPIWMALGFFMTGSLVAGDFAFSLLENRDADVLYHRPISSRTLFAARLMEIQSVVLLVTLGFFVGPAMAGLAMSGWNPAFPAVYLAMGLAQVVFLTLAVLGVYSLLARWIHIERVKTVASAVSVMLTAGMILSYQMQSLWVQVGDALEQERAAAWMYALPPAWFSAPVEMIFAGPRPHLIAQGALALLSLPLLAAGASRVLSSVYQERLARGSEHRRLGLSSPRGRRVALYRRMLLVRPGAERAGFELVARQYPFARVLQSSAVFVALLLIAIWRGMLLNPFEEPLAWGIGSLGFMYQGMMALVMVAGLLSARMSQTPAASWIMATAPIARYGAFYAGVKKAVLAQYLPVLAGCGAALCFFWPMQHALLYTGYAALVGMMLMHLFTLWKHELPLSDDAQTGAQGLHMTLIIMAAMAVGSVLGLVHVAVYWMGSVPYAVFWVVFLALFGGVSAFSRWILNHLSPVAHPAE